MNVEEELAKLSNKIDDYHSEDTKRAKRERYENLGYISWGFALATTSLAVAQVSPTSTILSAVIASIFVILGCILSAFASKYK